MALFFCCYIQQQQPPLLCSGSPTNEQIVENVLRKSNNGDVSYHVEKSISLNGIVAAFNSTNIYKIIENRCSSKKCYFEPFYNLKSFIYNGASGRVAKVGQSGSVANFFGEVVNTTQRKISIIRFYIWFFMHSEPN